MRHFPSFLPRVTKVDNRNFAPSFLMASTAGNIAYKREDGGWKVPKALDGFSEMTRRHHDKGAPFEPLKYD